uniref:Uncharacterized protein n=1 Tax=Schistocephalus solidus TaxID=70667 RepID=A0A0X3PQ99_SCHSO
MRLDPCNYAIYKIETPIPCTVHWPSSSVPPPVSVIRRHPVGSHARIMLHSRRFLILFLLLGLTELRCHGNPNLSEFLKTAPEPKTWQYKGLSAASRADMPPGLSDDPLNPGLWARHPAFSRHYHHKPFLMLS